MKNLDIEKLERKNIYTVPDHFFDDVQARVLQDTVPQKQTKIIKMNWAYAAAAAVAMIFGITIFVNQGGPESPVITETRVSNLDNSSSAGSLTEDQPQNEATIAYQTLANDLTSVAPVNQKENAEPIAAAKTNAASAEVQKKGTVQNPEVQVDQILANFTSAELADLGKNAEQDIYLDLYY
jgi:hypothetical protein